MLNDSIKSMKLDFLLLKPYLKSMALVLLVPLIFPIFTGSLFEGMSFAVTVMAMTTAYTSSIAEKNSLERFYGFLPVKEKQLVRGRYLVIFGMGFFTIILEAGLQSLILYFVKASAVKPAEIISSVIICALLFCIYAGVQIPGYYKYGSIKGKIFMFIPTVGFLIFYYLFRMFSGSNTSLVPNLLQHTTVLAVLAAMLILLLIACSVTISTKIVQHNKN